ncbi:hypothetical protein [Bacillus methanolicus]|uniref:Uncharacterized protein n=1 Tax=Bacillus methanolicus (strain MGA3 / ATCC 53907) TaxID=796606 RepID=I3E9I0_BACMM|nr:hypothetical protein [Bacillus methanolicus]AIE60399.1 hypothetical protein BMMGA3_10015 [Bacillus methanolicus MGA3]EIJ83151.1 hypothetical protein MGA3_08015 [Bacillus methanolicus MGA3]
MKSGNIEQFKELSQFRDLKDFNNHFEQWMTDLKDQFTKSETIALKRLVRFSAKIPGVCNAKIQSIVSATHKHSEMGGISRSTFERMLRKAKKFGLIHIIHTQSKNGRQGHSVYVFQKYPTNKESQPILKEAAEAGSIDAPNKKPSKNKAINLEFKRTMALNSSFVSNKIPSAFTNLVKCFFDDAWTIEEFYKVVHVSTRCLSYYTEEDKLELAVKAFKQLVRNIKLKKTKINNVFGYYWGICNKMLDEEYFEILNFA